MSVATIKKANLSTCKNRFCKDKFIPTYSTVQLVCSYACAIAYSRQLEEKQDKARTKELKAKLETHSDYEEKLQKVVNAIARKIDEGKPCISSGRYKGLMNGGHYISVAANNSIRFNLHNIHKQSFSDNHHKSSNRDGYEEGLIARYGHEYFEYVKYELTAKYPHVKLSIPELKEAIKKARQFLRTIKDVPILAKDARRARDMANKEIGIYK